MEPTYVDNKVLAKEVIFADDVRIGEALLVLNLDFPAFDNVKAVELHLCEGIS